MTRSANLLELLQQPATAVAPYILGAVLRHKSAEGTVAVRLSEVEAYLGPADSAAPDPGAHSYRGKTARNAVMFGPPGHLYVYFTYGMHYCANLVCCPEGTASGLLMRAGEVVEGLELARRRRPASRTDTDLAQGPARLAAALGLGREHNGVIVLDGEALPAKALGGEAFEGEAFGGAVTVELPDAPVMGVRTGPRVGVSGTGGSTDYSWRFWIDGDPTVSRYKPGKPGKPGKVGPIRGS